MIIYLTIPWADNVQTELKLRHILVDSIEKFGIGEVIEEGSSDSEISVMIEMRECQKEELVSLIQNLGFRDFSINPVP